MRMIVADSTMPLHKYFCMHNVLHQAFHCDLVGVYEVAALNLRLDNSGNTAAHVAALRGREDTFKV